MRFLFVIILFGILQGCSSLSKGNKTLWKDNSGFKNPESVYYEPSEKMLYISNINGDGTLKDGNGYISKVDLNGKIIQKDWAIGLNAPKGMGSSSGILWVSDIDEIVKIDLKTAKILKRIKILGAKFLNDIAIDSKGNIYISDTITSTIHKITNDQPKVFLSGPHLDSPNGLLIVDNQLYVASWGLTEDWNTQVPGRLYRIDLDQETIHFISSAPLGNLDGLEMDLQGNFIISDWVAGLVYRVDKNGEAQVIYKAEKGLADIAYIKEKKLLIIPAMLENYIQAYQE